MMQQRWPSHLWVVRHGESAGNVARDAAMNSGATHIEIEERDVDVPLSQLGHEQAQAVAQWFGRLSPEERPEVILTSPYQRAKDTAASIQTACEQAQGTIHFVADERLREKEFGVLDRLTREGIEKLYPDQSEFRRLLGKFYHRPPGGESWCDVILRLRSALDTMSLHHGGKRVLIVGHQVVVLCLRYLIEDMTEQQILDIDAEGDVANCSITEYRFEADQGTAGQLELLRYNFVAPLEHEGTPITSEPDANVAAR